MLLSNKNQTHAEGVIQCPTCQAKGIRQNLCKIQDGIISIIRVEYEEFGHKVRDTTTIKADTYTIICGRCGEEAYKKNG